MLLGACAMIRPPRARPKLSQFGLAARAAASRPPISPEVAVMENTAARVMISHLLTTSISLAGERLAVSITSFQFESSDMGPPDREIPRECTVSVKGCEGKRVTEVASRSRQFERKRAGSPELSVTVRAAGAQDWHRP